LIIKTTYKSHFKIKKSLAKNNNKYIFVKNMVVFFLFSKIFFKNCSISLLFNSKKNKQTNILKAPSRHKKFFHQVFYEIFHLKVFFYFNLFHIIPIKFCNSFFTDLNVVFLRFGTNVLNRVKFLVNFSTNPVFLCL
jgi:hypothetical protein